PPPPLRLPPDFGAFKRKKFEDFNGDHSTELLVIEYCLSKVTRSFQEMRVTNEDKVPLTCPCCKKPLMIGASLNLPANSDH
ncbi:hypothetical protein LINPERPRIM_LOCUS38068, partial [Linum perenne]